MKHKNILFRGKHLNFVRRGGWEFCERPRISGVVVVVAITEDAEILLVEQNRPVVQCRTIELPAGLAGDTGAFRGEKLLRAARRELLEETGYKARSWKYLFSGPPSAGITSEIVSFYLATNLRKAGDGGGDEAEGITAHNVPLTAARRWLKRQENRGLAIDPKVYAGLYFAESVRTRSHT